MQKRVIALSLLLILSAFVSVNFISATAPSYLCNIVPATNCNSSVGGNIVMGIAASNNAHGEFPYQSYSYALCCYFGNDNTTCSSNKNYYGLTPGNEIIGLTSSTNAHAQDPSQQPVAYAVPVCYWATTNTALSCISTTTGCDSNYYMNILNLSNYTNAHIGTGAGFNTAICCKIAGLSGGQVNCQLNSATWTYNSAMQGVQVGLNVTGTNCAGATVTFNITDSNGNRASNYPGDVTFPLTGGNSVTSTWTAEYHSGQPNAYKFTAKAILNNNILQSGSPNATLSVTQQSTGFCSAIITCGDYKNQTTCSSDNTLCNVAKNTLTFSQGGTRDPNAYASQCLWNTTTSSCTFMNIYQANGLVSCNNGYTLCTNQTSNLNYCYPGNTCPSSEIPLSNGNGVCDAGEGCSSIDCHNGDQDNCASGSLCQAGMCYKANSNPVNITQCASGYTLCYDQPKGLTYCYPNDVCPTGDSALLNSCANSGVTNGNNGNPSSCTGDATCTKTSSGGYCSSPTASSGNCVYTFLGTGGNNSCVNGFLTYKWTATWTGTGNIPTNCKSGSSVIECPAQISLPLFTAVNAIITIVVIIAIYVVTVLVRKSKKQSKSRRSHRRK